MRRTALALAATALAVVPAAPALAHASLDVAELPAGSTTDVVLRVPIERSGVGNALVEVLAPAGFGVDACTEDAGWTCAVEEVDDGTVVVFDAGDDGDTTLDRFGLTLTAPPEPRDDVLPTIQTYTDGGEVAWIGDGGDRPAPTVTVGAPDGGVVANDAQVDDAPIDDADPDERTSPEPAPEASGQPGADGPQDDGATTDDGADDEPADDAGGDALVPVAIGVLVLVVGAGFVLSRRRA